MPRLYNLKQGVAQDNDIKPNVVLASADGAINIEDSTVIITKASAAALTLAAPTAGTHDGVIINIITSTAYAHTVTQTSPGFNSGSTASDVATFTAAKGNSMMIVAYNGVWYASDIHGVALG